MNWLIPLIIFLIFLPFSIALDLATTDFFYSDGFSNPSWAKFIYRFGILPGWLLIIAAAVALFTRFRREGLYILLVLGIGSGLFCHAILKESWGRPRPKQVIEYGGYAPYSPVWKIAPKEAEHQRSFCSGHATMGYLFFTLYFIGRRRQNNLLAIIGLLLAISLGGVLSLTRIVQGGHFLSDTLVSALIMWLSAYFLSIPLLKEKP